MRGRYSWRRDVRGGFQVLDGRRQTMATTASQAYAAAIVTALNAYHQWIVISARWRGQTTRRVN